MLARIGCSQQDTIIKPTSSYSALTCLVLPPSLWLNFSDETIGAVQWSQNESVLPKKVKAALENRQADDQSQAPLPDATAGAGKTCMLCDEAP